MNRHERRSREAAMRQLAREDARFVESHLKYGPTAIKIRRKVDGSMILALDTPAGHYEWPLGMASGLAAGLRQCANGVQVPAAFDRHVWGVGIAAMYVAISNQRLPEVTVPDDVDIGIVTAPPSHVVRPQTARELADGIDEAIRKLEAA